MDPVKSASRRPPPPRRGPTPKQATKSTSSYIKVSAREHVLKRPFMYVGQCTQVKRKAWHLVNGKSVLNPTTLPVGMCKILDELLSNVGDNVDNSRVAGVNPGECIITIKGARITIRNGGLCVPISLNEEGTLIPEMIFGEMLSGSGFGKTRATGSTYGIGAKATNILSTEFVVIVANAEQRKMCTITWRDNCQIDGEPVIQDFDGQLSYVEVSYIADPKIFGYGGTRRSYEHEDLQMFHWEAACLSLTTQIPVTFNGERMQYTLESFALTFLDSQTLPNNFVVYIKKPPTNPEDPPLVVRAIILDTPNKSFHIGFANHVINPEGGVHVNAPVKLLKDRINNHIKADDSTKKMDIREIKKHISVLITATGVVEPEWGGGQAKTSMTSPNIPMEVTDKDFKHVSKWGIFTALNEARDMKALSKLSEVDPANRRGKYISTKLGEDATLAGTKDGHLCTLAIVEGDSAKGFWLALLDYLEHGKRLNGVLTLRGKVKNILKCKPEDLIKNAEIKDMVARLGLEAGKTYTNVKQFRYGKVMIMTDADEDGSHIKALLIAFFSEFCPSVFALGFIVDYMTPYRKLTKGNRSLRFYYETQYLQWRQDNPSETGWIEQYYKGLGSNKDHDIEEIAADPKVVTFQLDAGARSKIHMAMGANKESREKKQWIKKHDVMGTKDIVGGVLPVSDFIDGFLRPYSFSTISRNMPHLMDGLTNVARKIVFGAFKKWGRECTSKALVKVNDFAGLVSTKTKYHHGDSIQISVIRMAQEYVGSNNLPLLFGDGGRFGDIEEGIKSAAQPRYLEVNASSLLPYIFRKEDDSILTPDVVDGAEVEPCMYLPVIPMVLVNGVNSVSSGWRCEIPSYDPAMLIDAYLDRLDGKVFKEPQPFYRGHAGKNVVDVGTFTSTGCADIHPDGSYTVTCLPVGMWNKKYYKQLMQWVLSDKIAEFESDCTATRTHFTVYGLKAVNEVGVPRQLKLSDLEITKSRVLSNITVKGPDGFPIEYANVRSVMEHYYNLRLSYYGPRKAKMVEAMTKKMSNLKEKLAYATACYEARLVFTDDNKKPIKRSDMVARIVSMELNTGFYLGNNGHSKVSHSDYDQDGIASIKAEIASMSKELNELEAKTSEQMWREDLLELREQYYKIYNEDGSLRNPRKTKTRKAQTTRAPASKRGGRGRR